RYPLSRLAATIKRSVMRDLIALANSLDVISFAGGLPAADHLPHEQVRACLDAVLAREGARALQYGPPYLPLREWIAGYMQQRGVACSVENIFITNGAQQGLELIAKLLLDPGEPAALESLTFTGIGQAMSGHGAAVRSLPMDLETGVDVDALEAALAREPRPRLGVVIPDFHNPLGVTLPREKRIRIAGLAARYRVPIVEDDPYSLLRYEGEMLPPIKAFDEAGMILYLGSFSKMLAPAMRLGWLVAPAEVASKLTVLRESIDLESSQLLQRTATEFLTRGYLEPHLAELNAANRERRDALFAALDRELGGLAEWTVPQGGLFVWVTLPAHLDTGTFFQTALARKVAYIPGANFSPDSAERSVNGGPGPANTLRLNYSNCTPERIQEGISRLAAVIKENAIL
ncbi:MAG: PLP-dependent aminotransferase family protein, partial [Anaerolineales bacterium]